MKFIQLIEYSTTRYDEIESVLEEWLAATEGKRTTSREITTKDRDRPNTYVDIIEFASYEAAMKNNALPATQTISEKMMKLCDGPAVFRNLDVVQEIDGEEAAPKGGAVGRGRGPSGPARSAESG